MDAIALLEKQHREVEALFKKIEKADTTAEKTRLFRELAGNLVGHDGIERQIFYPACEEQMGLSDELGEALVEHGVVEFSLYQADQATGKPDFDFKLKVLQEVLEHHIKEEESEFFPKARKALGQPKLESLCEEMMEAFEDALEEDFHKPLYLSLRQVMSGVLKPELPEHDSETRKSA